MTDLVGWLDKLLLLLKLFPPGRISPGDATATPPRAAAVPQAFMPKPDEGMKLFLCAMSQQQERQATDTRERQRARLRRGDDLETRNATV